MSNLTTHLCKHVSTMAIPLTFLHTFSSWIDLLYAIILAAKDLSNLKATRSNTWLHTKEKKAGKELTVMRRFGYERG